MTGGRVPLRGMQLHQLEEKMRAWGEPSYRVKQLFGWAVRGAERTEEMTNLPASLRGRIDSEFMVAPPKMLRCQVSEDGTRKYLWELADGESVETVLMNYRHGNSVCISTQVGCRMGCTFCASTKGGHIRNLHAGEMIDQVLFTGRDAGVRVSNVVLMGIGEPLENMEQVLAFIGLAGEAEGLSIGQRHISLSTCGLCDKIDALAQHRLGITLSVSLHAPTDTLRRQIMPVANKWPLDALMDSCRRYFTATGRRISYEYAMIRDFNDSEECAHTLASLLAGQTAHVNLIPLNEIEESVLRPSSAGSVRRFQDILTRRGLNATVRRQLGYDIDASCGQLRRNEQRKKRHMPTEKGPARPVQGED